MSLEHVEELLNPTASNEEAARKARRKIIAKRARIRSLNEQRIASEQQKYHNQAGRKIQSHVRR